MTKKAPKNIRQFSDPYKRFKDIDGTHPLKEKVPGSYIEYQVRTRHKGTLLYFNYDLAKDVGLIDKNHPSIMNAKLNKAILDAFAIVIINEHDIEHGTTFPEKEIRKNKYMATRYLQLQHHDKIGLSSGDGRSVWNGQVKHEGKTWDVSSRGTGSTRLSPASAIQKKFFKTGDPTVSYGCGLAEKDEAMDALFFSEVLHQNGVPTERTLAIIEFDHGFVIGVRIYPSLLRPSHFFVHLKQGNLERLERMANFYLEHQQANGEWLDVPKRRKEKYEYFLFKVIKNLAQATARFEINYIFCWMDWDGDNLLMDGGIIDYGSIRQFGLYHEGYRYDDSGKFSTTITEQRIKARYIVQTFIQMVHFLTTGKKRQLKLFSHHRDLKVFDRIYEEHKKRGILEKIGFQKSQIEVLLHCKDLNAFIKVYTYFERTKSYRGVYKVEDGISHDAVFCMRDLLRELPPLLLIKKDPIDALDFMDIIKSSYAKKRDLVLTPYRRLKISQFQKFYLRLVEAAAKHDKVSVEDILLQLTARSAIINKYDRITGDSISTITARLIAQKPALNPDQIHRLLESFIYYQDLNPDKQNLIKTLTPFEEKLLSKFFKIVREYREWG